MSRSRRGFGGISGARPRRAATFGAVICALVVTAACDERPPPIPQPDSGMRADAGGPRDGGTLDAGSADGGERDAAAADAGRPDADGGRGDAQVPSDGSAGGEDGGTEPEPEFDAGPLPDADLPDICEIEEGLPCGPDDSCPSGRICLDNGCGERRCYPAGRPCGSDADCPSGSECADGVCGRASGCADSRDCPEGFSCDEGSCVDRRIGCGLGATCPQGFICDASGEQGAFFCIRVYTRCADDAACPAFGFCRDVAGEGGICHHGNGSGCRNNAECAAGQVCGVHPEHIDGLCSAFGPCASDDDCAGGYECVDLWGDGVRECVPAGGSCSRTADCPPPAICASPAEGGVPRCIERPL